MWISEGGFNLKVVIRIETENPESVKVYLTEILNQISKNRHFSITDYRIEIVKNE